MPANKTIQCVDSVGGAFGSGILLRSTSCIHAVAAATKALKSSPLKRLPRCFAAIGLMGF
jgi:hypothetical protein